MEKIIVAPASHLRFVACILVVLDAVPEVDAGAEVVAEICVLVDLLVSSTAAPTPSACSCESPLGIGWSAVGTWVDLAIALWASLNIGFELPALPVRRILVQALISPGAPRMAGAGG